MSKIALNLYISGQNPKHLGAAASLRALCEEHLSGCCDLEVIDVARDPHRAEQSRILALPALIKLCPLPEQRMIGDFSSIDRVLTELGITSATVGMKPETSSASSHEPRSDTPAHG